VKKKQINEKKTKEKEIQKGENEFVHKNRNMSVKSEGKEQEQVELIRHCASLCAVKELRYVVYSKGNSNTLLCAVRNGDTSLCAIRELRYVTVRR